MIYVNGQAINTTFFPDNTTQVWKLPISTYPNYVQVVWQYSHESEVMQLAQLKALLDHHEIKADLDIKYLPYARQDKEISNEATFALKVFADILNKMKFERVAIQDPHSSKALDLIKKSYDYYPHEALAKTYEHTNTNLVCYPDAGAARKYSQVYLDFSATGAVKVRNQSTGEIEGMELNEPELVAGKRILIVDDICDGGRTFTELAKLLREAGAVEVNLFVTHGIFSKGLRALTDYGINAVFTPKGKVLKSDFQKGV
jgi:ribose-phosphate pyrophosphokinase